MSDLFSCSANCAASLSEAVSDSVYIVAPRIDFLPIESACMEINRSAPESRDSEIRFRKSHRS